MADLDTVSKRIDKIANKARIQKDKESIAEMSVLTPLKEALEQGKPARMVSLSEEQEILVKSFHLLTKKPIIYVANVSEEDLMDLDNATNYQLVVDYAHKEHNEVIPVSCEIESQISVLANEERKEYMDMLGITESGLSKDFVKTQHSSAIKLTLTIPPSFVTAVVVGVTTGQVVSPSHLPC
jgi:ribosome-binding ATPase YchF (GTP1/OBG family)